MIIIDVDQMEEDDAQGLELPSTLCICRTLQYLTSFVFVITISFGVLLSFPASMKIVIGLCMLSFFINW